MSLADARVEIIADLSTFRRDLREQMAEAADYATRILNNKTATNTRTAKDNLESIPVAFKRAMAVQTELARNNFNEKMTTTSNVVREHYKTTAKQICDRFKEAADCAGKALEDRLGKSAGKITDQYRVLNSVLDRALAGGKGQTGITDKLRGDAGGTGDDLSDISEASQRRVLAALQRQLAAAGGAAATAGTKAPANAAREAEKAALAARKAFRDLALNASDDSRRAAQAAEDALKRVATGGGQAAQAAAAKASAAAQEAAQAARKAADDAVRGSGEIADSTARAATRAADAAERSAARAARAAQNALESGFGDSSGGLGARLANRLKSTFGLLESESGRAGRTNGQTFISGLRYSFTAGIGITFGVLAAKAALLVPFIGPIVSVLQAAVGAATALASALGTGVVGAAVAATAAVGGILAAVVTTRVGFGGIVDALKQKQLSDKAGVTAAGQTGVSARSSQRQVDNATQQVASSQVAYNRSLRESKDATRDAKIARDALTDAYTKARRALEDYDLAVKSTAYDELDATEKAKKAHEALRLAYSKRGATAQELSDAQLAADKADLDVTEAKLKHQRAIEDKSKADAKGVNGSDEVVAALKAVQEADERVADAQQNIKDAALAVTNAIRDRNDAIADSAEKTAGTVASATKVLDDQLKQLAPNALAVYYSLERIYESYKLVKRSVQQRLFAGTAKDLDELGAIYLPKTQTGLGLVADALNRAAKRAADFGRTADTKARVDRIFANNAKAVDAFLAGTQPLLHIIIVLADKIAPFGKRFGDYLANLLKIGDASLTAAEKSGALQRFLDGAYDTFTQILRIIGLFGKGLLNVFAIGQDTGAGFLDTIEKIAADFREFTAKPENRDRILKWFTDSAAAAKEFGGLVKDVVGFLGELGGTGGAAGFIKDVRELGGAVAELLRQISGGKTAGGILDTITQFIESLNKAEAGTAIHEFIDTAGDIVYWFSKIVGVVLDVARTIPGGTDALHGLAVVLGTYAAFKFVSMSVGLGGALKDLGKLVGKAKELKKHLGGKATSTLASAAEDCVQDAIDPCADLDDLAGGVPGKAKKAGKVGAPTTRAERKAARKAARTAAKDSKVLASEAEKTARAASKTGALKNFAGEIATIGASFAAEGVSAGKKLGGGIVSGVKSLTGKVAEAGKSLGAAAISRAKAVLATGDRGALDLGAFVPGAKARRAEKGVATAAKTAGRGAKAAKAVGVAADVADVGGAVAKGGKVAAIGKAAKDAVGSVAALTGVLATNTGAVLTNAGAWAANAAKVVATKAAMLVTRAATIAYTAVQWLLNAAMAANPIGLVVIAIVALVAIFVIAYKKSETFRNIIKKLGQALLGIGEAIWGGLKAAFGYVTRFYKFMFDFWTSLPGKIVGWISQKLGQMKEIGGKLIRAFLDGVENFAGKVSDFGKNLANGLIDKLNTLLNIVNSGLAKIPRVLTLGVELKIPTIPRLARGAIIERRTIAELGEDGREVVIPLTKPARAAELAEQSGLVAMLQLKNLLPAPGSSEPKPAPSAGPSVDRSVHVENLHVHHNGKDTARATEKALRRVARLAMS